MISPLKSIVAFIDRTLYSFFGLSYLVKKARRKKFHSLEETITSVLCHVDSLNVASDCDVSDGFDVLKKEFALEFSLLRYLEKNSETLDRVAPGVRRFCIGGKYTIEVNIIPNDANKK